MISIDGTTFDPFLIAAILAVLAFCVQLFLCFQVRNIWIKLLPALPVLANTLFAILLAVGVFGSGEFFCAAILAGIVAIDSLILGTGVAAAWLVYALVFVERNIMFD